MITVLCLALLAGWGFDELDGRRPSRARPPAGVWARAVGAAGRCRCVYAVLGGHVNTDVVGRAVRAAWLFQEPDGALVATPAGAARGAAGLAARMAGAGSGGRGARGRCGCAAGCRCPPSPALPWRWWRSTCSRRAPATTRRSSSATPSSPRPPAISYLQASAPERFAGLAATAPATLSPPLPAEHRPALRGVRRPRQRDPHRGALRGALAPRDRRANRAATRSSARSAAAATPRVVPGRSACSGPTTCCRAAATPRSTGCGPSTPARTRASTATRRRSRARSWWTARWCSPTQTRSWRRSRRPASRPRAAAVTERKLPGLAEGASARQAARQRPHHRLRRRAR